MRESTTITISPPRMKKISLPVLLSFFPLQVFSQVELTVNVPQNKAIFLTTNSANSQVLTVQSNILYRWDLRTGRCLQQKMVNEKIRRVEISIYKKYFITYEWSGSNGYVAVYDASTFNQVVSINIDSLLGKKDENDYMMTDVKNICIDEKTGWLGAVTFNTAILYNLHTHRADVVKIEGAYNLSAIAPLGSKWLIGGESYAKQLTCIWTITPPGQYNAELLLTTNKDDITELIPEPEGKFLLAIIENHKAAVLKDGDDTMETLRVDDGFTYYTEGANYQYTWNSLDGTLYINTDYGQYTYKKGGTQLSEMKLTDGIINIKSFFIPYEPKSGLYLNKNYQNTSSLSVRDFIVTGRSKDTSFIYAPIISFGNPETRSTVSLQKTGGGKYILNNSCILNLNTLEAQPVRNNVVDGFSSSNHVLYFAGSNTYGEPVWGGDVKSINTTIGLREYHPDGFYDTTYRMITGAHTDFLRAPVYKGYGDDTLYIIDAMGRKAFIYSRVTRKILTTLDLPPNLSKYPPLYENRFTALPGGDFLFGADQLFHYDMAKKAYKIIDETILNYISFLAFDTINGNQLYYTQDKETYRQQVKSYNVRTGDTIVLLDGPVAYSISMIRPFLYQGTPCWVVVKKSGGVVEIRSRNLQQELYRFVVEKNTGINDLAIDTEKKQLLFVLSDNSVRIISAEDFQPVARLYFSRQGKEYYPVAFDNENNYFMASRQTDIVNWVYDGKAYDFSAFDKYFNKPALLLQKIKSNDTAYIKILQQAYATRLKRLRIDLKPEGIKDLPLCTIQHHALPYSTDSTEVKIPFRIRAVKYPVTRYQVYINNVPQLHSNAGTFKRPLRPGRDTSIVATLSLTPDRSNHIYIKAFDDSSNASLPAETYIYRRKADQYFRPKIWYLGFGAAVYKDSLYNLKYSAKDVTDMAGLFKTKPTSLHRGGAVAITDSLVVLDNIIKGFAWLADKASADDIVIISFSGHGITARDGKFYFMLYDTDFSKPEKTSLPFEAVFEMLKVLPCRNKLVLLDACESGDFDEEGYAVNIKPVVTEIIDGRGFRINGRSGNGPGRHLEVMKEYFADISTESGATIIGASSGTSLAFEKDEWKNGIFSFAFMKGLFEFEADANGDHRISISELSSYIAYTVDRMTNGKQMPSVRNMDLRNDWIIAEYNSFHD